ncbi:Transcriptional repressor NF-X1 -like protein [Toxocara canis]|uniref:Transcriptional repressor NF-X1-like protein n=1 Tax=Toxocara canis TaxID=6265 RepID=A0A0B2UXP9_TOXCA|nr:Transcriptional repressor NF-X1 -like protein [Toxocara canis]
MTDSSQTGHQGFEVSGPIPTSFTTSELRDGRRRRGGRGSRGGFHYHSDHYQSPLVGPNTEFYTPPPAVFDIPPRFLPPNMFNANVVPLSERDAQFEAQFASYIRNAPPPFVPSNSNQGGPVDTLRNEFGRSENATTHIAHSHVGSRGGSRRGVARGGARHMQRQSYDDLESFFDANIPEASVEEGYGCPPSYLMESYRDEADRQQVAMAAAMLTRGRRGGKQIFPGRRRGHSYHLNTVSAARVKQRSKHDDPHEDGNLDTLRGISARFPDMPHSCNATCGKSRGFGCPHPCNEQCHPGPCPECPSMVTRSCNCGAETKAVRCGTMPEFQCSKVCGKTLNCGVHKCEQVCHKGDCGVCEQVIVQHCYCGADERTVACTALNLQTESYSCGAPCQGVYACGIHKCDLKCHAKKAENNCGPCSLSPEKREYCPCGRSKIDQLTAKPREACTDPIPTCDNVCGKVLPCGNKDKPHRCKQKCHTGPCPPCPDNSSIVCRCKALKKNIPCKEFTCYSESNPLLCERRCRKLKSCQNHRCQAVCCVDKEHVCMQICNKKLECGNHNCDRLCHVGQCPRCLQASFEEQYCLCGHTVREPPIPCGTSLPPCDQPCSRQHACDHPPMHNCHAEPECPPCTVLTEKPCYGGHEIRANIPCYLNDVSCGRPCEKNLPCGMHTCKRTCHPGPCLTLENPVCKQPCPVRRTQEACDHICGLPCHGTEPCPKSVCVQKIMVSCGCLRKTAEMRCVDVEKAYQKALAVSAAEASDETSSAPRRILKRSPSVDKYRCIPCDADCHRILRNKRVANALSIATDSESNNVSMTDGTAALSSAPVYTDFLKSQLKSCYKQVLDIENALQHNGTTRTHVFRPMTSENRRIIHEYASYFRIETTSYDAEPLRNVVATAKRGSCCVPLVLLTMFNNPSANAIGNPTNLISANDANKGASSSVPSVEKDFSWSTASGMHQLQSAGKVIKRGFADAARAAQK